METYSQLLKSEIESLKRRLVDLPKPKKTNEETTTNSALSSQTIGNLQKKHLTEIETLRSELEIKHTKIAELENGSLLIAARCSVLESELTDLRTTADRSILR